MTDQPRQRTAHRRAERVWLIAAVVLLAALAFGVHYARRVLGVAVAYKAKMLCSGLFVAHRGMPDVLSEIEIDDLARLRHVDAVVDRPKQSVVAAIAGIQRRAAFRDGLGCALIPDTLPIVSTASSAAAGPLPRPSEDGVQGEPQEPRLAAVVDRAFMEPATGRRQRTQAIVIVHRDKIVAERYAAPVGPHTPLLGWSMTKSVMNALVGILVHQGRLSLDSPAPVREWTAAGDVRGRITVDHLLRMTSGLRFDESMSSPLSDVTHMLLGVTDAAAYATNKRLEAPPGTLWHYSSGVSNILALIVRRVLNDDRAYHVFPRRALFDRIGMPTAVLEADASGTFVGSSYMYATARDWARFGSLYLRDGEWNGNRILPPGWVNYSRSPTSADPQRRYGAHFWLGVPEEYGASRGQLPADAFHAIGHEGQFITIVPSLDLVIVRLGRTRVAGAWDQSAFVRDVVAALDSSH